MKVAEQLVEMLVNAGIKRVYSVIGYYNYSVTSLIAGVTFDRVGGKYPITEGTGILCLGCLLFGLPIPFIGNAGPFLQGTGSAFAFTGCVYLASHGCASFFQHDRFFYYRDTLLACSMVPLVWVIVTFRCWVGCPIVSAGESPKGPFIVAT